MTHSPSALKKTLRRFLATLGTFAMAFFVFATAAQACVVTFTNPLAGDYKSGTFQVTWTDDGAPDCATTMLNVRYNSPSNDAGHWWTVGSTYANNGAAGVSFDTTLIYGSDSGVEDSTDYSLEGDTGGGNIGSVGTFTIDNTPPTILSATTADIDGNGKVDQLTVVFDESMDNTITSTTGFTYGAYTLAANGTWSTTSVTDDTLTIAVTENGGTCDYTSQAGCDTADTSNVAHAGGTLTDLAGNGLAAYAATPATDGAKPAIVGAATDDFLTPLGNGQIDTIYVQFSEDVDGTTVNGSGSDFVFDLGYTASAASEITGPGVPSVVAITLVESGTPDTDVTPTVSIAGGQTIQDLPGNALGDSDPGSSILSLDRAAPAPIYSAFVSGALAAPAGIGVIEVTYSEPVVPLGGLLGYDDTGVPAGVPAGSCFGGPGTSILTVPNANPEIIDVHFAPNYVSLAAGGVLPDFITDWDTELYGCALGVNLVAPVPAVAGDLVGNIYTGGHSLAINDEQSAVIDQTAATSLWAPSTPPITWDVNGNGKIDAITFWMTENMDPTTVTAGDFTIANPSYTVTGATAFVSPVPGLPSLLQLSITENANPCNATDQSGCDTDETPDVTYAAASMDDAATPSLFGALFNPTKNSFPVTGESAVVINDGADPVNVGLRYESSGSNGTVDQVIAVFSENVNYGPATLSDWAIANNGLTNLDSDGTPDSFSVSSDEVTFGTSGTSNLTGICSTGGEPTLAYSSTSGNDVTDNAGNDLQAFGATSIEDHTRPFFVNTTTTAGTPTAHPLYGTTANSITDTRDLNYTECLASSTNTTGWNLRNKASGNTIDLTLSISNSAPTGTVILDLDDNDIDNNTGHHAMTYDDALGSIVDDSPQGNELYYYDSGSGAFTNLIPPVPYRYVYQSSGNNDVVDRAYIYLTEEVSINGAGISDWSINNQGLTGFDDDGTPQTHALATTTYNNDTIELTTSGTSELTGVGTGTEPDVTYTAPGDYDDLDTISLASFGPTSLADEAGPIAMSSVAGNNSVYMDATHTGSVTSALLHFTEPVNWRNTSGTYYDDPDWTITPNNLTGFDFTGSTDVSGDDMLVFNAVSTNITGVGSGGTEPDVSHPGGDQGDATIEDGAGNMSEAFTITLTDDADPVLVGFVATPGFPNPPTPAGIGDWLEFDLTFSEDMDTAYGHRLQHTNFGLVANGTPYDGYSVTDEDDSVAPHTRGFLDAQPNIYEGFYSNFWGNRLAVTLGTPVSGLHSFDDRVTNGEDPVGNPMAILAGLNLTFLIDSVPPDTTGVEATPNPVDSDESITITATVSDDMQVTGATLYIDGLSAGAMTADDGAFDSTVEEVTLTVSAPVGAGVHTIYVLGSDLTANAESQDGDNTETLTVNGAGSGTGPEFYITQPGAGETVGPDFTLAIDTDGTATGCEYDTAAFTYETGIDMTQTGTSWYDNLTGISAGTPTYYVVCSNGTDTTQRSRDFVVEAPDTTEPELQSTSPDTVQVTGSVAPVIFVLNDNVGFADAGGDDNVKGESDILNFTLDTTDIITHANTTAVLSNSDQTLTVTYNDPNLAVGVHNFNLKVQDAAGNDRQVSMTVDVVATPDTTPPSGSVTTGNATVNADLYVISGTLTADSDDVTVTIDDGSDDVSTTVVLAGNTSWSALVTLPQDTATTFTATAADGSGNPAVLGFVTITEDSSLGVDSTPPNGTVETDATTVDADFYTIEGTLEADSDPVTITINDGSGDVGTTVVAPGNTSWSVVVPLPQDDETTFTATAWDLSGNSAVLGDVDIAEESVSIPEFYITQPTAGDTVSPPFFLAIDGDGTSVDCQWSDEEFDYGDEYAWEMIQTGTSWYAEIEGYEEGEVTLYVVCIDDNENEAMRARDFVVGPMDTTPPTLIVSITNISTATADIIISVDEDSDYMVEVDDNSDFSDPEFDQDWQDDTDSGPFLVNVDGLEADTLYYVRVTVSDEADGGGNTTSGVYAFQTNEEDAPILTNILLTPDSEHPSTDATVNWETAVDDNGEPGDSLNTENNEVEYGTTTQLGESESSDSDGNSEHEATLTGLSPNTVYYYRVKSTANGKTSYSQIFSFTTARGDNGLYTDSIVLVKSTAAYDATDPWTNGWHFRFEMTADSVDENYLRMKLDNWVSGTDTLATSGNANILVSSSGYSDPDEGTIAAGTGVETTYGAGSTVDIDGVDDNNPHMAGKQFVVDLFVKIPSGQPGGAYSTSFGLANQDVDDDWADLD